MKRVPVLQVPERDCCPIQYASSLQPLLVLKEIEAMSMANESITEYRLHCIASIGEIVLQVL
jgi:hypothetical protein